MKYQSTDLLESFSIDVELTLHHMDSMEHPFFFKTRRLHPTLSNGAFPARETFFRREIEDPIVRLCVDGVAEIGSNGLLTCPIALVFLRSE